MFHPICHNTKHFSRGNLSLDLSDLLQNRAVYYASKNIIIILFVSIQEKFWLIRWNE